MSSFPARRREGWIEVEEIGDVTVVHFDNCKKILDEHTMESFKRPLIRLVGELGRRKVLLNLEEAEFWSSAPLGTLITLHRMLQAVQGKLVLCNVASGILDVVRITKLDKILTIITDPELTDVNDVIREVFGNPFRVAFSPDWRTLTAVAIARGIDESRDLGVLPILADALQDAGCDNEEMLALCRASHVRGCWVCELVLGK